MVRAVVSTLVSQLMAPSGVVTHLVGTTLLSLPVVLPGPSIQLPIALWQQERVLW